jgi:hypothetical protein
MIMRIVLNDKHKLNDSESDLASVRVFVWLCSVAH